MTRLQGGYYEHGKHVVEGNEYTLTVRVPDHSILAAQNLFYNYYYQNPKYLIVGYLDP